MKKTIGMAILLTLTLASGALAADTIASAFSEGTIKGEFRTYFFQRDFDGGTTDQEDFVAGGKLYYRTAPFKGLSAGTAFYTSRNLHSDDDKGRYGGPFGLLAKGDNGDRESYTALGEYYLQGQWLDTTIKYGAQEINTPWLNTFDIRMTPLTYKALKVVNKSIPHVMISAYHVTEIKGHTDTEFKAISKTFKGVDEDEPLIIGGLAWKAPRALGEGLWDELAVEGWDYYVKDIINSTYVRLRYGKALNGISYLFEPRYFKQDDSGDGLAGEIDTYMAGAGLHLKGNGANLSLVYGEVGDDALQASWGSHKMIKQQVHNLRRAEEEAYGAKLGYGFCRGALKGLSAYVFYADYDTPDSGNNASEDIEETDFSVQYKFGGDLKGLSLRVRYAIVDEDENLGGEDHNDFRVYLKYRFGAGGKKS